MRSSVRHRIRIALAVILCLLFQQVAIAAYACTIPSMPPDAAVMVEDCADMSMEVAQEAPALCAKHCSPDHVIAADHAAPGVPPLEYASVLASPVSHVASGAKVPVDRSDPPARLRYCSLLI